MRTKETRGSISYLADAVRTASSNIFNNRLRSFLTVVIVALGVTCLVGSQTAIDCLGSLLAGAFGTSAGKITITSARESSGSGQRTATPISYCEAAGFKAAFDGGQCSIYTCASPLTEVGCNGRRLAPQTTVMAFDGDYFVCNGLSVGEGRAFFSYTPTRHARLEVSHARLDRASAPTRHARLEESHARPDRASAPTRHARLEVSHARLEESHARPDRASSPECVVGGKVAAQVCRKTGEGSAVGQMLNIGGKAYRIAGVLASQSSLLGVLADNTVYIPLSTAVGSLVSESQGYSIDLSVDKADAADAALMAEALMCRIRHTGSGQKPDFEMIEGSAAEREIEKLGGSLSSIALIIGLLTLLGAAVALTNIMLICAAERTREVGIRRAVGATRSDIRTGFIAEALLICEAGCLVGTLLGIACGNALGLYLDAGVGIPWDWILIAQAICLITGIAACTLPARRAARVDVVVALRCE